ncbi:MAG TPA: ABC transporter ATP-binding protein [Armatimonadota bacterium]|nr:ABC transporter ATP-binding protein [Armatimonadota bacterium]
MGNIVEIQNLTKQYRNITAVWNLSLTLEEGDVFGFIGPNGAGKTTTIKMLATLLRPTTGTATVAGHDVVLKPGQARGVVGYMPDDFGVYEDIRVWEYLDFFAAAYQIPRSQRGQVIDDVLALTDLTDKRSAYVDELSRGMKQRLCLAKTLVHDPKVLLLDEPASGLDPRARIEIRELLKELQAMGKTIFISSHILAELSDFCNKIGIIENGQLVVAGEVREIIEQITGHLRICITVRDGVEEATRVLAQQPGIGELEVEGRDVIAEFTGTRDDLPELVSALVGAGVQVSSFAEEEIDLEDIFIRLTRGIVS